MAMQLHFWASNNKAKYEVLLIKLCATQNVEATQVLIHLDSKLVAQQMGGSFKVKEKKLQKYMFAYEQVKEDFTKVVLNRVLQKENYKVDELMKKASFLAEWTTKKVISQVKIVIID